MRRIFAFVAALALTMLMVGSAAAHLKPTLAVNTDTCASVTFTLTLPDLDPPDGLSAAALKEGPTFQVAITEGPTFDVVAGDNTFALDPGDYSYQLLVKWGDKVWPVKGVNGDFTVNRCPPKPVDISFSDCTAIDGQGSITVTGFNDPSQKVVVTPGDLAITEDGTYPLDPGSYSWQYTDFTGGAGDDFTIGACPTPPALVTVTFLKQVEGGTAAPADFVMHLNGDKSFKGVDGQSVEIPAGTYTLTEDQLPGYVSEFGGGCYLTSQPEDLKKAAVAAAPEFTFNPGESWTCGFRNTYSPESTPTPKPSVTPAPTHVVTPPPTDTVGGTGGGSGNTGILLAVLLGLGALSMGSFVLTRKAR